MPKPGQGMLQFGCAALEPTFVPEGPQGGLVYGQELPTGFAHFTTEGWSMIRGDAPRKCLALTHWHQ